MVCQVHSKGKWDTFLFLPKLKLQFEAKPEKSHTFREPEPRPPVIISLVFTGLCAVPLLGLLIAWKTLGINVNKVFQLRSVFVLYFEGLFDYLNFQMESSYLPFHAAIASVFGLYFLYWYKVKIPSKQKSKLLFSWICSQLWNTWPCWEALPSFLAIRSSRPWQHLKSDQAKSYKPF